MGEQAFGAFKLEILGLEADVWVERFEGEEEISRLFRFDLDLTSHDRDIPFANVVGRPALLTIETDDAPRRHVHGLVSRFEQGEEGSAWCAYHATLVPRAWRLLHRHDARIFQELAVPDILKKVLETAGLSGPDYRLAIEGSHPVREYCVQYRETDWAFVSRLMEEEGIHCFFEHHEDRHVLVMADGSGAHKPIEAPSTLPFRTSRGVMSTSEAVTRFRYAEEVRPGKVTLTDFDFKKPGLSLLASTQARDDMDLEVYDYPGEYDSPGVGASLARIRLEEHQVVRKVGEGDSGCARMTPGTTFTLSEHGRDEINRSYLITGCHHRGAQPRWTDGAEKKPDKAEETYRQSFRVVPDDLPFRPARRTPRPTVRGVQTAIVVGPAGEEIYTDEHGRVKVQFHWDRQGKRDEKSSCWMRVSQLWAGAGWGAMFVPRIGQEVIVDFIEGDPDRPIVTGRVYHGTNVPPYPLPADKTRSTIKSNSTPGGGGSNELRFEDKKGQEEIYLHGQKDWVIKIEHDKSQLVGHDERLDVEHDRTKLVKNDQSETIGNDDKIEVGNDRTETIGGNETEIVGMTATRMVGVNQEVTVGVDGIVTVGANAGLSVGAGLSITVGGAMSTTVAQSSSEMVEKSKSVSVKESYTLEVQKELGMTVALDMKEESKKTRTMIVGDKLSVQCGDATIVVEKNGNVTVQGKKIVVKGEGPVEVDGKKIQVKSDGGVNVEASGKIVIKGSNVGVN